ncbi:MAG: Exonuclease VII, large subunit [halophilic archaeon J07HX5]|nr:MAG: Exonuclease VII, large subunit [halophilic archaeon J07HX5]
MTERSPRTTVSLYGASVQGEGAVSAVVTGVQALDADPTVETIVITRGGGADVTLTTFDAEPLVRAVAACSTPTVVAIGHEDDQSLAERAADARAMTPTEAGVVATPVITDTLETLAVTERRIASAYETLVDRRLTGLGRRVEAGVDRLRQRRQQQASLRQRAEDLERRIDTAYRTAVTDRLGALETRIEHGLRTTELLAQDERATARVVRGRVAGLEARIETAYRARVERELQTTAGRLTDAYRDVEAAEQIATHRAENTRLRVVVVALVVVLGLVLLVGVALVAAL